MFQDVIDVLSDVAFVKSNKLIFEKPACYLIVLMFSRAAFWRGGKRDDLINALK
jgi:hypothetical protein